ncbi:MAG: regulatory protein RecX [Armatimonadota bacterium]
MRRRSRKHKEPTLDEAGARERCLRLLSVRARSAAELRARLARAGFEETVVSRALSDLAEAGLVDDEEFARSWIAGRSASGIGRHRLRSELAGKGIERAAIERLLAEQVDDRVERRRIEEIAARRLAAGPRDAKAVGRVRRLLLGRGFGYELVDDVLRAMAGEDS